MNTRYSAPVSRSLWMGLSLALHLFILACLFISLVTKPSLLSTPQKTLKAFPVPAPVVFYGHEMDPQKTPGSVVKKAQKSTQIQQNTETKTTKTKQAVQQNVSTAPKSKELTLSDIFSHARQTFASSPHVSNLETPGDGAGQPIVIREGDMKYYSLWSTFLKHLNDAARFNRVKKGNPVLAWLREKKIKKNMQCGITVNKKGDVQSVEIISSSGYSDFDQLCIEDIWSASPFPPLPDLLGKTVARFEVTSYL